MVTDLTDACADLERWLPALATALERDNTPTSARNRNVTASVVNPDVLHALCTLRIEVPATAKAAATLVGEAWSKRPIATCLRALPRFHDRLEQLHFMTSVSDIEHNISHWTAITKHALGLRLPDTPIGYNCPYHPDQPYPLVAIGAEGHLTDQRTVIWQHAGVITCRHCATDWPATQWLHLGRILEAS